MFGQIAAANALSDIYAMGGVPKLALNLFCISEKMPESVIKEILRGGADKAFEAGAIYLRRAHHLRQHSEIRFSGNGFCASK